MSARRVPASSAGNRSCRRPSGIASAPPPVGTARATGIALGTPTPSACACLTGGRATAPAARQDRAEMLFAWAENGCTVCGLRVRNAIWAHHVEPGQRPAARVRGDALLRELANCRPLCPNHAALVRREQALVKGDVSFDDLVAIVRRKYPETVDAGRRSHLAIPPTRCCATLESWDVASKCRSPSAAGQACQRGAIGAKARLVCLRLLKARRR